MCVQYRGGYHDACGGDTLVPWGRYLGTVGEIPWYRGVLSIVGDIMMHVGYHEYRGGGQHRGGINLLLFEYPHGTHDTPPHAS